MAKNDTIDMADRIRKARLEAGLSQTDLGNAIGLSDKSISAYEKGRATPPVSKLKRISEETHRPLQYFTGDTDEDYTVEAKLASIEEQLEEIRKLLEQTTS